MSSTELAIVGGDPVVSSGPLSEDAYDDDERTAILAAAGDRADNSGGPHSTWNRKLEDGVSRFTGIPYAVSVPNATSGMRMGLRALGIGPGDEVIVAALDWKSTAMTLLEIGARPVFCDIEWDSLHIDPLQAEKLITGKTRAIVISHVHGTAVRMTPWLALADLHGLFLIEDPAQSLGATWTGRHTGSMGKFGCVSFNWKKLLTTGDGGVLLTNDDALRNCILSAGNFGEEPAGPPGPGETATHHSLHLGGNERLNPLAAAAARQRLKRIPALLAAAQANAELLAPIGQIPGFSLPQIPAGSTSTYHLVRVTINSLQFASTGPATEVRDRIVAALRAEGVPAGYWGFEPLCDQTAFRRKRPAFRTIHPDTGPISPVDTLSMPVTREILRSSFVLGRAPDSLQNLPPITAREYVMAFEKIAANMEAVMSWPKFEPLRRHPPLPGARGRGTSV